MQLTKFEIPLTIRFRIIPVIAIRNIPSFWNRVAVKSFGTDGFCFFFNENLEVGTLIDVKIDFQEIGHTTHCIGEIDRIEQCQPSSLFCITIKLKEMKRQEKEIMVTIVKEMVDTKNEIPITFSKKVVPLSYLTKDAPSVPPQNNKPRSCYSEIKSDLSILLNKE